MVKAAVMMSTGEDLVVHDDIEQAPPGAGEVKVKVVASGVCHSDLSVQNGTIPLPGPIVLGHEGAGVVEEIGAGVTSVAVGDHVVLSFVPECGDCYYCNRDQGFLCEKGAMQAMGGLLDGTTRLTLDGQPLRQMAMCGTFGNYAIVPEISLVKIDDDVDLRYAALISCGVLTGVGAALNTADIREGDSVAVVGCGGVGLNVIQGARIAGAEKIIAVDMFESKLKMAEQFGATDLVKADEGDAVTNVTQLTGGRGVDVAFEVIGRGPTIDQAVAMARRGGQVVLVGLPPLDVRVTVPAMLGLVAAEKTIRGSWYGSSKVAEDIPELAARYLDGTLQIDPLVSARRPLSDAADALAALRGGQVARTLLIP